MPALAAADLVTAQDVAAQLDVTTPTASVTIRRVEEAGWLERRPDPQDRRASCFYLTPQAEKAHQLFLKFRRVGVARFLAGLDEGEQETLLRLLAKAIETAESETGRPD